MEHATKLLVIVSVAAALLLETLLAARAWPGLPLLVGASFAAAACVGFASETTAASVVMLFVYLTPALVFVLHGDFSFSYGVLWMAALLGAFLPRSVRTSWRFPARWKAPLVLWALVVALTWPLVVLRELDFTPSLLDLTRLPISGATVNAPVATIWICDVAVTTGAGILWFDWLFLSFGRDGGRFRRSIVVALAASGTIAVATGIYQLFGDVLFLNSGMFGFLQRGSGTMRDANPFGVVAAVWGPALVGAAWLTSSRLLRGLALCGVGASWMAVWASSGRTAFGAGFVALAFLIYAWWSGSSLHCRVAGRTRLALGVLLGLSVLLLPLILLQLPITSGPVPRVRATLPAFSLSSLAGFTKAMWDRDGYGLVSLYLIRQFPLFGVGAGSFHLLVSDYFFLLTRQGFLTADNAQNWFRHQLAELGLVGSVGWIWWSVMYSWFVLSVHPPLSRQFASTVVKGLLVAVTVVSLVGMPTQNVAVAMTFWTFAFWFWQLAGRPEARLQLEENEGGHPSDRADDQEPNDQQPARMGMLTWTAVWILVAFSVSGTAYTARHRLRVPQRAVAAGWPYAYGFAAVEPTVDLARPTTAWAGRHAVAVLAPSTRWVKLTVVVDRLNLAKGPVDVKVLCDDVPVFVARVTTEQPNTMYVRLQDGRTRMLVETWVSRSVRPSDYGLNDNRERGLLVEWDFVDARPTSRDAEVSLQPTAVRTTLTSRGEVGRVFSPRVRHLSDSHTSLSIRRPADGVRRQA